MILVIGGTGTVGSALVSELARREVRFRVLLRRPGRTELPPGAEPVAGDLARPQTLRPALEGVDAVFLLSPPAQDMETLLGNGIDEARRAGVRHVVKLSAIGAAPDAPFVLGRWHHATDAALARSGLGS